MPRPFRTSAFALVLSAAFASAAPAQLATPAAHERTPEHMLADQLTLLMRDALAGQGMPTEDQFIRAGVLLDLALELSPRDAELWRTKAELAEVRGRSDERRQAITEYLRLVPGDDAAQLQLILTRVNTAQTLDERLALLERFLDAESGRSLSQPLRSRLASTAALAAKELGDSGRYVKRLKEAIALDSANGAAARMLYELALRESQSPLHHGAAAIAWVRGEPASPEARLTLAEILLKQGVYDEASKQFSMAAGLAQGGAAPDVLRLWVSSIAMEGQVEPALGMLRQMEGPLPPDTPSSLPMELEMTRLTILGGAQRREEARAAWVKFVQRLQPHLDQQDEAAQRELAVAGAVFGHDAANAEGHLPVGAPEAVAQLVRGWAAIHAGQPDAAREQLRPIVESDPLAALGIAAIESDAATRVSMLDDIRHQQPDGIAGLLATMELRRVGASVKPTREGESLRAYLTRWPSRVWYTDLAWSPWISMRLEITPPRLPYLTPIEGVASFRNLAGVPLSVGEGATVPTRMIVSVIPSKMGQTLEPLAPLVVDIGRTLTIPEGGSLRVPFRLDHSALGSLLAMNPTEPIDLQATAVLDPRPDTMGGVRPGPVGAMDTNRAVQASAIQATPENIEGWLLAVVANDSLEQFRSIARLMDALESPTLDESLRTRIGDTIASQFEKMNRVGQAWTLRFLPAPDRRPASLKRVADQGLRSREPLVRVTQLAAQVRAVGDGELAAGLREEDPVIGEFARALRTSLRETPAP